MTQQKHVTETSRLEKKKNKNTQNHKILICKSVKAAQKHLGRKNSQNRLFKKNLLIFYYFLAVISSLHLNFKPALWSGF